MAEEDDADELHRITGSPCDEIDPAELFENHSGLEAERNHVDDKGSGSEFDSEREDHVDLFSSENDLSDGFPSLESFPYGTTPPRNIRRQKERFKKEKERVQAFLKNPFNREHGSNPSEKAAIDRRKKRGSSQLMTERAFQRKLKRGSVDTVAFNVSFDSGVHLPDSAKSLEIPSIKIESTSRFMSLDCVCEDSTDGGTRTNVSESIPIKRTISRGHPRATRSESDPRSSSSRNYLNPYCPEARMDFYRTFSLLIKLGSLANQQENQKQHILGSSVERQHSEENTKWQVELSQALWLELQAWHANRTMEEQDLHLMRARANVEEVLDEVINFKVKKQDATDQSVCNKGTMSFQDGNDDCFGNDLSPSANNNKEANHNPCCQSGTLTPLSHVNSPEGNEAKSPNSLGAQKRETAIIQTSNEQLTLSEADDIVEGSVDNVTDIRALKSRLHLDLSKKSQTLSPEEAGVKECRQTSQEGFCCQLKAAIDQVTELFDKIERVENLYPTRKSLGEQIPKYKSEKFIRNFETMCLWLNITRELYHKLHLIAKFVGVNPADTETWKDWLEVGLGRVGMQNVVIKGFKINCIPLIKEKEFMTV